MFKMLDDGGDAEPIANGVRNLVGRFLLSCIFNFQLSGTIRDLVRHLGNSEGVERA